MVKIQKVVLALGALGFLAAAGVAFAQTTQKTPSWFAGSQSQFQQMVASRLAEFSQVRNKSVCTDSSDGYASCGARVVTDSSGHARSSVSTPPSTALGPAQLDGAYGLGGASTATIGIVDAYNDPNIAKDLSTYDSYYGLPNFPTCSSSVTSSCFQIMNESGAASPLPASNASWSLEISLDVEVAHAACPSCRILLVEAKSNSFTDLLTAVDTAVANGAAVVNGSWGGSEFSSEASYDSTYFEQPAKAGVVFTFSAGDGGYVTSYPAASPYVTAVGGTSLVMSGDNYASESVWNSSLGATGSGCSAYEAQPAWQAALLTAAQNAICPRRVMNDVSADADPASGAAVYDSVSYDGTSGWFQVGGTSLASPLIAATYALAGGVPSGVYANSLPYSTGNYSSNLHDVTTGSNSTCGSYLCTAQAGYDGPTGLGTPDGTSAFSIPSTPVLVTNLTVSDADSGTVVSGATDQMSAAVSPANATNKTVTWSETNGTGSATISSSGLLLATGVGTVTVTATATDGSGVSGTETITITAAPTPSFSLSASPSSLSVSPGGSGNDTITVHPAGGFSGSVTLSVSGLPSGTSASFSKNPTSSSSTLRLSVGRRSPAGTYVLTIQGKSGSLASSASIMLVVK